MTQRDIVLGLLEQRRETGEGVSAHELTYQYGITRSAAIIHTLRHKDGLYIETENESGKQATYFLRPRPAPPPAAGQLAMFAEEAK